MKKRAAWFGGMAFLLAAALSGALSQSGEDLFQKALRLERNEGKLMEAIGLYQKAVAEAKDVSLAAQAQLRIGLCHEKLGQKNIQQAQEAFQKVIDNYPSRSQEVKIAKEKLSVLLKHQRSEDKADQKFQMRPIWSDQGLERLPGKGEGIDNVRPSPDGKFIAFIDWNSGYADLWIQEAAEGKTRCLTRPRSEEDGMANVYDSRWSPDGRRLAYIWENDEHRYVDLRVVGLEESRPRTLHRGSYAKGWVSPLDWSPDGKNILVIMWQGDSVQFGLVPSDGGDLRIIKTFMDLKRNNDPTYALFSPDGRTIAFDSQQGKDVVNHDLYLLALDGGQEWTVASHPSHDYLLGWALDGGSLIFASDRAETADLWTVPVQDGKPAGKPSLAIKNIGIIKPLGITNEGTLYFNRNPNRFQMNVYTAAFDPDSGRPESAPQKLALTYEGRNVFPDWSPDGSTLAYVSRREPSGQGILCLYSADSGKIREMSFPHMLSDPHWSKDGRFLLVMDMGANNIFRIDLETANIQTLIEGEDAYSPAISPDMNFLFFVRVDSFKTNRKDNRFLIMKKNLETGREEEIFRHSWVISDVELSPDGENLALVLMEKPYGPGPSIEKGQNILGTIPTSGGDIKTLHEFVQPLGSGLVDIDWSPDGRYIVFSKIRTEESSGEKPAFGPWQLWRVPPDGGRAENLGLEFRRFGSLSVHPDGHRIAFFSRGTDGKQPPNFWLVENFLPKDKNTGIK
ncbi:MAG: PD40 domain-containing protein [Candidatus Aminicenantes bacterium]|nr:PD40 domain-containing protein [Candidatus Aminicenantes bacterium]